MIVTWGFRSKFCSSNNWWKFRKNFADLQYHHSGLYNCSALNILGICELSQDNENWNNFEYNIIKILKNYTKSKLHTSSRYPSYPTAVLFDWRKNWWNNKKVFTQQWKFFLDAIASLALGHDCQSVCNTFAMKSTK